LPLTLNHLVGGCIGSGTGPAFTFPQLTDDTDPADVALITPVAGEPTLLSMQGKGSAGVAPTVLTVVGCNLTWRQIYYKDVTDSGFVTLWVGTGDAPVPGQITVTLSGTIEAQRFGFDITRTPDLEPGDDPIGAVFAQAYNNEEQLNHIVQALLGSGNRVYIHQTGAVVNTPDSIEAGWTALHWAANGNFRSASWTHDTDVQAVSTFDLVGGGHSIGLIVELRAAGSTAVPDKEPRPLTRGRKATPGTSVGSPDVASITPLPDELILVETITQRSSAPPSVTGIVGNSLPYVEVGTPGGVTFDGGTQRSQLWWAKGEAPTAGALTFTLATACDAFSWQVVGWGTTTEILQHATGTVAAGTTLAAAAFGTTLGARSTVAAFYSIDRRADKPMPHASPLNDREPFPEVGYQHTEKPFGASSFTMNWLWRWTSADATPSVLLEVAANGAIFAVELAWYPATKDATMAGNHGKVKGGATIINLGTALTLKDGV
jgi:hypothetical protein